MLKSSFGHKPATPQRLLADFQGQLLRLGSKLFRKLTQHEQGFLRPLLDEAFCRQEHHAVAGDNRAFFGVAAGLFGLEARVLRLKVKPLHLVRPLAVS